MSLQRSKLIFIYFFVFSNVLFCEKVIKKITSDITEYDRKTNSINFYGNVKIETTNGFILCNKANYKEKENRIICENEVYFVYTSTSEKAEIEVKCSYLYYDTKKEYLEFKENVYAIYNSTHWETSDYDFSRIEVKCEIINLYNLDNLMIFKDEVIVSTKDSRIFCDIAEYKYKDKLLTISSQSNKSIEILSLTEKLKMKSCYAKIATLDFDKGTILLKGAVEVIF